MKVMNISIFRLYGPIQNSQKRQYEGEEEEYRPRGSYRGRRRGGDYRGRRRGGRYRGSGGDKNMEGEPHRQSYFERVNSMIGNI